MFAILASSTEQGLTLGGWAVMSFSILLVLGLVVFCFWHLLAESSPSNHHHAPLDIDTGDTQADA